MPLIIVPIFCLLLSACGPPSDPLENKIKELVINIKEERELDYAKKSTILNPYFMAFRNKALENEFLDLLRDFFKKLV